MTDSTIRGFRARAEPGDADYLARVAKPVMDAVDAMPPEWRALVHEFGYVDVYRARRMGMSPAEVRQRAQENGGVFKL